MSPDTTACQPSELLQTRRGLRALEVSTRVTHPEIEPAVGPFVHMQGQRYPVPTVDLAPPAIGAVSLSLASGAQAADSVGLPEQAHRCYDTLDEAAEMVSQLAKMPCRN